MAGSVGTHRFKKTVWPHPHPAEPGREELNYYEATKVLLEEGVDLIFIEMVKELTHGGALIRGLSRAIREHSQLVPVFLGLSAHFMPKESQNLQLINTEVEFTNDRFNEFIRLFVLNEYG